MKTSNSIATRLHNIEAVVDRLVIPPPTPASGGGQDGGEEQAGFATRLTDSVETALKLGDGFLIAMVQEPPTEAGEGQVGGFHDILFSEKKVDPATGISYPDLEPKLFSFNSPHGACPECQGLGSQARDRPDAASCRIPICRLNDGAIAANGWNSDR